MAGYERKTMGSVLMIEGEENSPSLARRANALSVLAVAFLVGPFGVLAPKALVVLVVLGGVAGVWSWLDIRRFRDIFNGMMVPALGMLLLWSVISAMLGEDPEKGMVLVFRLTLLNFAGLMLFAGYRSLDDGQQKKTEIALLAGFGIAVLALVIGFVYAKFKGGSLWGNYFFDPLTTLNNGAVIVSLMLWPVLTVLCRRGQVMAAIVLVVVVLLFLSQLSSGASLLAAGAGGVAFVLVRFGGNRGGLVLAIVVALLTFSAPYLASAVIKSERVQAIVPDLPPSARHRLKMWDFVLERIDAKPMWGWGMDSSRSIPQEKRRLAPNMEIMPLHPHNAALQVRLELGLPGSVIFAGLVFLVFLSIGRVALSPTGQGILAAAAAAYMAVGGVSYGVWQNWWISAAWLLAGLTWLAVRSSDRAKPSG